MPFVCVCAALFYIRGISTNPVMQPIIFGTCIIVLTSFYILSMRPWIKKLHITLVVAIIILTVLLSLQYLHIGLRKGIINEAGRIVLPLIVTLSVLIFYENLTTQKKHRFYSIFIKLSVILLVIDLMYRLWLNGAVLPTFSRYEIKRGGLLFVDSNFNAMLSFLLWLEIPKSEFRLRLVLLLIVFWSLSIAVYVCLFLHFLFIFARKNLLRVAFSISFFGLLLVYYNDLLFSDGSFQTKLEIIRVAFSTEATDKSLLGVGFGNFNTVFDIKHPSHNLFGLYAEGGVIFIFALLLIYWWLYTNGAQASVIYMIIIGSISLFPIAYMAVYYLIVGMRIKKLRKEGP